MRFLIALEALILLSTVHVVLCSSFGSSNYHDLFARSPSGSKTVIIQMFEWNWDSVAAECTNFIGPAGYGFVQGSMSCNYHTLIANALVFSESPARAYHWPPVVDRLPARILYFNFQAWRSQSIPKVSSFLFFSGIYRFFCNC